MLKIGPKIYPAGFFLRPPVQYKPGSVLRYARPQVKTSVEPKRNIFQRLLDRFFKKLPEEICNDDFVTLKHSKFLGFEESGYNIFHGSKNVGYVHYEVFRDKIGSTGKFPLSWFYEYGLEDARGSRLMKPYLRINEFSMNDRLGKSNFVPRKKKYGAMAMKEILRIANEEGCGDRITLFAGSLGGTKFGPGRFYNKMGFSLTPERNFELGAMERRFYAKLKKLTGDGLSEEQAKAVLRRESVVCPEKINGRYVENEGIMNLTNPECIRNYSV